MSEQQSSAILRCKAHHTYEAQRDDELTLMKGDLVTVTDHSDPDWWVGETADGKSGYFPSNFVDPVGDEAEKAGGDATADAPSDEPEATPEASTTDDAEQAREETPQARVIGIARVMEDYAMQEPGEITLHRGVIVNILEDNGEYMKGEINGKVGVFPSKYVEFTEVPGQPEFGRPSSLGQSSEEPEAESKPKPGFKLAAYGVKQGGIGSLLAGGIPVLRPGGAKKTHSQDSISKQETPTPKPPQAAAAKSPTEPILATIPQVTSPQPISSPGTPATPPSRRESSSVGPKASKAIVTHHYDPDQEDELSLMKGEYITILERDLDDGWWRGRNERGETGVFPANFVKEISDETPPPPPSRTSKRMSSTSESAAKSPVVGTARPPLARPPSVPSGSRPSSHASSSNRPSSITENAPLASPPPLPTSPSPARGLSIASSTSIPSQEVPSIERTVHEGTTPHVAQPEEIKPAAAVEDDISDIASDVPSSMAVEVSSSVAEEPIDETPNSEEASAEATEEDVPEVEPEPPVIPEQTPTPGLTREVVGPAEEHEPKVEGEPAAEPEVKATEDIPPVETKEEEEKTESPEITQPVAESTNVEEKEEGEDIDVKEDEPTKEDADATANDEAGSEEPVAPAEPEETKPDFDSITSGPKLATPNRARPSRSRRPQESKASEPSQTALLEQEVAKAPEEKATTPAEEKAAPAPPAKPIKPIFQKFPTPFAGADASARTLKPVQRRMWEPAEATQESTAGEKKPTEEKKDDPPRGVKNISSRFNFAGVPSGGGNEVLETKLRNHTKNEVEKARKELERQLNEEREERLRLEEKVADLSAKLEALMAQVGQ